MPVFDESGNQIVPWDPTNPERNLSQAPQPRAINLQRAEREGLTGRARAVSNTPPDLTQEFTDATERPPVMEGPDTEILDNDLLQNGLERLIDTINDASEYLDSPSQWPTGF